MNDYKSISSIEKENENLKKKINDPYKFAKVYLNEENILLKN